MTEVSFYVNVADPLAYTCRLVRKALRGGSKLTLAGPAPTLARIDRALWEFDPTDFVPHLLARPGQAPAPRLRDTPVWLVADLAQAGHHDVLVNLFDDAPPGFESYARVVEIVADDDAALAAGRQRWRHYASRGYAPVKHEVSR